MIKNYTRSHVFDSPHVVLTSRASFTCALVWLSESELRNCELYGNIIALRAHWPSLTRARARLRLSWPGHPWQKRLVLWLSGGGHLSLALKVESRGQSLTVFIFRSQTGVSESRPGLVELPFPVELLQEDRGPRSAELSWRRKLSRALLQKSGWGFMEIWGFVNHWYPLITERCGCNKHVWRVKTSNLC